MRDMGLFVSMLEDGTQYDILQGNLFGYKGGTKRVSSFDRFKEIMNKIKEFK